MEQHVDDDFDDDDLLENFNWEENGEETLLSDTLKRKAPITLQPEDGNKRVKASNRKTIFWVEMCEHPVRNGCLLIFGKVEGGTASDTCCLVLPNVCLMYFIWPKSNNGEQVSAADIEQEITVDKGITGVQFLPARTMYNCFMPNNLPNVGEYVLMSVPSKQRNAVNSLPSSGRTYEKMFCPISNYIQHVQIACKLRGPCWIDVDDAVLIDRANKITRCDWEFSVESLTKITRNDQIQKSKFLNLLAINIETCTTGNRTEIVALTCAQRQLFNITNDARPEDIPMLFSKKFCCVTIPMTVHWKDHHFRQICASTTARGQKCKTEKKLLEELNVFLDKRDVDVFVGPHVTHHLWLLMTRMRHHNIPHTRLSRLVTADTAIVDDFATFKRHMSRVCFGRLVVDLSMVCENMLVKCRNYQFDTLCKQFVGHNAMQLTNRVEWYYQTPGQLNHFIDVNVANARLSVEILLHNNIFKLAFDLAWLLCTSVSQVFSSLSPIDKADNLLSYELMAAGFFPPMNGIQDEPTLKIEGGKVLEPITGYYIGTLVAVLDFVSLYPSIVMQEAICFTTRTRDGTPFSHCYYDAAQRDSTPILARVFGELVRAQSANATTTFEMNHQKIKRRVVKNIMNAICGCLASRYSRYYAPHLNAEITARGRNLLMTLRDTVQAQKLTVVYGDTDSLMINVDTQHVTKALAIANQIINAFNTRYKCIKLNVDYIFKNMMLFKKKRYAGLSLKLNETNELQEELVMIGLDAKRKDACELVVDISKAMLQIFLNHTGSSVSDVCAQIAQYLSTQFEQQRHHHQTDTSKFILYQTLPRDFNNLNEADSRLFIRAAIEYNLTPRGRLTPLVARDVIPHIVCVNGADEKQPIAAYHVDVFKSKQLANEAIEIDSGGYYKEKVILPVIKRLCELLPATMCVETLLCPASTRQQLNMTNEEKKGAHGSADVIARSKNWASESPPHALAKFKCPHCTRVNMPKLYAPEYYDELFLVDGPPSLWSGYVKPKTHSILVACQYCKCAPYMKHWCIGFEWRERYGQCIRLLGTQFICVECFAVGPNASVCECGARDSFDEISMDALDYALNHHITLLELDQYTSSDVKLAHEDLIEQLKSIKSGLVLQTDVQFTEQISPQIQ